MLNKKKNSDDIPSAWEYFVVGMVMAIGTLALMYYAVVQATK